MTSHPPMRNQVGKMTSNQELTTSACPIMRIVFGGVPLLIGYLVACKMGNNHNDKGTPATPAQTASAS